MGAGKRERENAKARKREEKAQRRLERRERGPGEVPIVSAEEALAGLPSVEEAMAAIERRATEPRSATAIPARLFVGGLGDDVTERDLRTIFGVIGPVADAVVMLDRDTGAPRGFGFVTMADRRDAARACNELHGTDFKGRNLVVNLATSRGR
jgi:RNA recognition motif-containing protein